MLKYMVRQPEFITLVYANQNCYKYKSAYLIQYIQWHTMKN